MSSVASVDLRDVRRQDLNHVWHPLTQYEGKSEDDLLVIVSADGCEVMDSGGKTKTRLPLCPSSKNRSLTSKERFFVF